MSILGMLHSKQIKTQDFDSFLNIQQALGEDPVLVVLEGVFLLLGERPGRSHVDGGILAGGGRDELHCGPHVGSPDRESLGAVEVERKPARVGLFGDVYEGPHHCGP
ncbi:hypothetical protein PG996_004237 [Apiospora saccharicola]|uniref:Uncharacterized protein n=1 Tax=Apiospora saccharicola TaxID=335842 RepID=A0ABR1W4T4_9PEZI